MKLDKRLQLIFKRRSIRKFTPEPISDEEIRSLLQAGMAAPSAHNKQPWYFIVIKERTLLNRIAEVHPYARMLYDAPLSIAVCADPSLTSSTYWVLDCSAAAENILLAATALGLGSVWIGIYPRQERMKTIKKILSVPDHFQVLSLIAIGHPAEKKEARTQFNPQRVFLNSWGNNYFKQTE